MKHLTPLIALASLLLGASSLSHAQDPSTPPEDHALHAQDFDLEAVVALIEHNRISDAAHLEEVINSEESGINNVDLDWDGLVDRVSVVELREGDTAVFELIATPSSDPKAPGALVASITFTDAPDHRKIQIVASFPEDVQEHDQITFAAEALHPIYSDDYDPRGFTDWVYEPCRPAFVFNTFFFESPQAPPQPAARPQPTRPQRQLIHSRATFRRNRRIPPIPSIPKPNLEGADRAGLAMRQIDPGRGHLLRRSPMSHEVDLDNRLAPPSARAPRALKPRNIIYILPKPLEPSQPSMAANAPPRHDPPRAAQVVTTRITTTRHIATRQVTARPVTARNPRPAIHILKAPRRLQGRRPVANAHPQPVRRSNAAQSASARSQPRPVHAVASIPGRKSNARAAPQAPRRPGIQRRSGVRFR